VDGFRDEDSGKVGFEDVEPFEAQGKQRAGLADNAVHEAKGLKSAATS